MQNRLNLVILDMMKISTGKISVQGTVCCQINYDKKITWIHSKMSNK